VTCSDHGTCIASGGQAFCDCDSGYLPSGISCEPVQSGALTIPTTHPRLFWTPERLASARAYFVTHPFSAPVSVGAPDQALDAALHGLLTDAPASCRRAIDWALGVTFDCPGVACDPARWDGEGAIVTFDWCHAQMTEAERQIFIDRWNTYIPMLNAKDWGGIGMEGNNYYLGYLRNTLEFAIASYHENDLAPGLLDYGLTARWENSLRPYYDDEARGGAPHEGSAYGRRVFAYLTIPMQTLTDLGRDMWNETPYFQETIYWSIYSTTPGLTAMPNGASVYETFPFNEDERWLERDPEAGNTAQTTLGTYLAPLIGQWAEAPIAGHAQHFLGLTGHAVDDRFAAYAFNGALAAVAARDFDDLPLDYVAMGLGMFYTRNSWQADATLAQAHLSTPMAVGHAHLDTGSFQLWRDGQWLTRETVGYAQVITGYAGNGSVDCGTAVGHNSLLFNGLGPIGYYHHRPEIVRLESQDDYSYLAVDLTGAYEVAEDWAHREEEVGNPAAGSVVRELLFIRPLETLVIFDRLSAEGSAPAAAAKSFLVHFQGAPTVVDGRTYERGEGDQTLRVTTLLPPATTRRVLAEGGTIGQYRAEIETSGSVESYFLHVLQGRGAGAEPLALALSETGGAYTLTLTDGARGQAVVTFAKGMASTGGTFGFAASGTPTAAALRGDVQPMNVTTDGPAWGD
jgi:hypothetical protein